MSITLELGHGGGATAVDPAEWDALVDENDPFLEHSFLAALERSRSVGPRTGWMPHFVWVRERPGGRLVAAVPLYVKAHSYGEFVFDWSWAGAAARAGIPYYPKLVAAVPFTPVTGQRLLCDRRADPERRAELRQLLLEGLRQAADATAASSIHVLFCTAEEAALLAGAGFPSRLGLQFHWQNRTPEPYRGFDDFLSAFRSRNRKQVRKERQVAAGHGLRFETRLGSELSDADWAALEGFYEANIDKHGGARYLTPAFFRELREHLPHRVVATLAYADGTGAGGEPRPVAGTLNFERGGHLYGRYWGCVEERDMLHFELCYYRLIDRAVNRGLRRFEAGAQGEHKLKRGLDPALTHSAHWIRDPGLGAAVARFLQGETAAVTEELEAYRALSPYARPGAGKAEGDPSA